MSSAVTSSKSEVVEGHAPTDIVLSNTQVFENTAAGTVIGELGALDPDMESGEEFTYALLDSAGGRFMIVGNKLVVAEGKLDFETAPSHEVKIRVVDSAGLSHEKSFKIEVLDQPEFPPMGHAPTDISLSGGKIFENSVFGTVVGELSALDPDVRTGEQFTYTLLDNADGRFMIVGNKLVVADGAKLDFETGSSHEVKIRVEDSTGLSYEETFAIDVLDVNEAPVNHAPKDIDLSQNVVRENSPNGAIVGMLNAVDPDEETGEILTYTLLDDAGGRFKLFGPEGHYLQVADGSKIDFETASTHTVKVRVTDYTGLFYDEEFTIYVKDEDEGTNPPPVNQAPTDIDLSNHVVQENAASGTVVGVLNAEDSEHDVVAYALLNDAGGRFKIVGNQLVVADGSLLDFETAQFHEVKIRVIDAKGNFYDESFRIELKDVNEAPANHAPTEIVLSNHVVDENSAGGTVVGVLNAVDPDANETFTFEMVDNAGGRFQIGADGKSLVVADGAKLDYEELSEYHVRVRVKDAQGLSYEQFLTIHLKDVNEVPANRAPIDITLSDRRVNENSASGTVIGFFNALDLDAGSTFTYTLLNDADGRFKIEGDKLVVADGSKLDFETSYAHEVKVRVSDQYGATYDKVFAIGVIDVNEGGEQNPPGNSAPSMIMLNGVSVHENSANGTVIGQLNAFDPDGDTLTFSLLDDADGRFAVQNGKIVVADGTKLDFETATSHQIKVRVSDGHGGTLDAVFTIHVRDVFENQNPPENHAPTDILLSGGTVFENAVAGTVIGELSAVDPDAGEFFTYELLDNAGGRFQIVDNRIVVAAGANIDFETDPNLEIKVRVKDKSGMTYDETFTVHVKDVNEAPPVNHAPVDIELAGGWILENSASGKVAGVLNAIDPDAGDVFTYSLLDDAGGLFKLAADGRSIVVADGAAIDYETASMLTIKVRVKDAGGSIFDKELTIKVGDVDEDGNTGGGSEPVENHAPFDLDLSNSKVHENAANGTLVGVLATFDEDDKESFTYALVDSAGGAFKLVGSKLVVADSSKLDFEAHSNLNVKVRVTDAGGLSYTEDFVVSVQDVLEEVAKGSSRNDVMYGGRGNDKFNGGLGNDKLVGGLGRDTFVFDTKLNKVTNVDKIVGYSIAEDTFALSKKIFNMGKGKLKSDAFVTAKFAKDAEDRIIFDKNKGALYYDEDGKGGEAQVKFATVDKGLHLKAGEFIIV